MFSEFLPHVKKSSASRKKCKIPVMLPGKTFLKLILDVLLIEMPTASFDLSIDVSAVKFAVRLLYGKLRAKELSCR